VFGEGDLDVVLVNGYTTHVELVWESDAATQFLEAWRPFARVINFDRRGSGSRTRCRAPRRSRSAWTTCAP